LVALDVFEDLHHLRSEPRGAATAGAYAAAAAEIPATTASAGAY
jgi:hypothetical protein